MTDFEKWIKILGGVKNASKRIDCSRQTISNAKARGILSPRLRRNLIEQLGIEGVYVDYKAVTLEMIDIAEKGKEQNNDKT